MLSKDKMRFKGKTVSQGPQGRDSRSRPLLSPFPRTTKCGDARMQQEEDATPETARVRYGGGLTERVCNRK